MKNTKLAIIIAGALALVGFTTRVSAFQPVVTVPLDSGIAQNMTLKITSTPNAPWNAGYLALDETVFDASAYTQARFVVSIGGIIPNNTTSLFARFLPFTSSPFQDNTFSDYLELGTSGDIGVTFDGTGSKIFVSPWMDLAAGAIGDDVLIVGAVDTANLNKQPAFGSMAVQFH